MESWGSISRIESPRDRDDVKGGPSDLVYCSLTITVLIHAPLELFGGNSILGNNVNGSTPSRNCVLVNQTQERLRQNSNRVFGSPSGL
jgi:hypothetical protein